MRAAPSSAGPKISRWPRRCRRSRAAGWRRRWAATGRTCCRGSSPDWAAWSAATRASRISRPPRRAHHHPLRADRSPSDRAPRPTRAEHRRPRSLRPVLPSPLPHRPRLHAGHLRRFRGRGRRRGKSGMKTVLHTESSPGLGGQEVRTLTEARWTGSGVARPRGRAAGRPLRGAGAGGRARGGGRANARSLGCSRGMAARPNHPARARRHRAHPQLGGRMDRRAGRAGVWHSGRPDPPRFHPHTAALESGVPVARRPRDHERRSHTQARHRSRSETGSRGGHIRRRRPRGVLRGGGRRRHAERARLSRPVIGSVAMFRAPRAMPRSSTPSPPCMRGIPRRDSFSWETASGAPGWKDWPRSAASPRPCSSPAFAATCRISCAPWTASSSPPRARRACRSRSCRPSRRAYPRWGAPSEESPRSSPTERPAFSSSPTTRRISPRPSRRSSPIPPRLRCGSRRPEARRGALLPRGRRVAAPRPVRRGARRALEEGA